MSVVHGGSGTREIGGKFGPTELCRLNELRRSLLPVIPPHLASKIQFSGACRHWVPSWWWSRLRLMSSHCQSAQASFSHRHIRTMLRSGLGRLYTCTRQSLRVNRISRMSTTSAAPRHKFLVYAPDKTNEGTFEKRLSVRSKHLETANERNIAGILSEFAHSPDWSCAHAAPTMQSSVVRC